MGEKIEPTDAMVHAAGFTTRRLGPDVRAILRAGLSHPDARGLFTGEDATDARPWESLGESDQVCVGDEVKWDYYGLTMTATVARVDKTGSLYTAAGLHIGVRSVGTWYVRRAVPELPTEDGAVIIPADGHEFIEIRAGKKSRRLTWDADAFVWYDAYGTYLGTDITTGTWKLDDQ